MIEGRSLSQGFGPTSVEFVTDSDDWLRHGASVKVVVGNAGVAGNIDSYSVDPEWTGVMSARWRTGRLVVHATLTGESTVLIGVFPEREP